MQRGEASGREGVLRVAHTKADREEWTVTVLTSNAKSLGCTLNTFACIRHGDGDHLWQVRSVNNAPAALGCGQHKMALHPHLGLVTYQTRFRTAWHLTLADGLRACSPASALASSPQTGRASSEGTGSLAHSHRGCLACPRNRLFLRAQSRVEAILPGVAGTVAGAFAADDHLQVDLLGGMGVGIDARDDGSYRLTANERTLTELITGDRQLTDLVHPADVKSPGCRCTLLRKAGFGAVAPSVPVRVLLQQPGTDGTE